MRLSSLIILLSMLVPGTLLADQVAFVIREAIAYEKPNSGTTINFSLKAGQAVVVSARQGGWKQLRETESQRLGWVRSYLVRERVEYRGSLEESKQDSQGFLSGLASLSRKVSGFFATPSASTNQAIATIGIRGRPAPSSSGEVSSPKYWLSPQRVINSEGDETQLSLLQTFASSAKAGRELASDGGLKARSVALLGGR